MTDLTGTHFIDGNWKAAQGTGTIEVIDPSDGTVAGRVPAGDAEDVDLAVAAASHSFSNWGRTAIDERIAVVSRVRDAIERRRESLARTLTNEMGAPITFARQAQVGVALADLDALVAAAASDPPDQSVSNSLVVTEPAGVVAAITPWNFPLHQIVLKLGAALLAGCTVVLKPSEVAPLNALLLIEAFQEAEVPKGTVNVVFGTGPVVGEPLVSHPAVDVVSFTGSRSVGGRVGSIAAGAIKKVALELGGKSAAVMLDDTDIDGAVTQVLRACFANAGQTCAVLLRLLVPSGRASDWVGAVAAAARTWQPADPRLETTVMGPLASHAQQKRVRSHIAAAIDDGARLVVGGVEPPTELGAGAYVVPTVFADVEPNMPLFREEVFGPVLAVTSYENEEHALALANESDFGLAGGVWSADSARALRFAMGMRTGTVGINGSGLDVGAPFGGYKQSGIGRECGSHGLAEFREVKSIMGAVGVVAR